MQIDPALLWNAIVVVVLVPFGYLFKRLSDDIGKLEKNLGEYRESQGIRVSELERRIMEDFVPKADFKDDIAEIKRLIEKQSDQTGELLKELFAKMDQCRDDCVSHIECGGHREGIGHG